MRVQVPRDIVGGSLLGAHNWVKSTITRTNPGGSTTDYKLQQTDGTPISLSDLTSRPFEEVLVISGNTRKNPHHNTTTNYPVAQPDWNYPSYTSNNRIGNNIAKLLAKDVDPSMLSRLAAQNGMFSALNTVTKLLYSQDTDTLMSHGSDPRIVALLQTYANSQRKLGHPILQNPTRAFMGPDFNQAYRGVVSPEEAVKAFASQQFGIQSSDITNSDSMQLMDRARIIRLYDLNNFENLDNFVDDVLTPFLAISQSNANLLKALRSIDYIEDTKKALGRYTGDYENTPQWRKLIALLPMKAADFYEGREYALVAHPAFTRESLATAAMDAGLIKHIFDIVKKHPANADEAKSPNAALESGGFWVRIRRAGNNVFLKPPEDKILWDMVIAQQNLLDDTLPEDHIRFLRQLYLSETRDQDIAAHISKEPNEKKVLYLRDFAGFRPTPPPFWPKPVVLAMMDTLRNHIWSIIDETKGPKYSTAFMHLGGAFARQLDPKTTIKLENAGQKRVVKITSIQKLVTQLENTLATAAAATYGRTRDDGNYAENNWEGLTNDIDTAIGRAESIPLSGATKQAIEYIIVAASENDDFFKRQFTPEVHREMMAILYVMINSASRNRDYDNLSTNTLNLLSLFVEVEEIARSRYNYTMTENDRAFVLFLMEEVFGIIYSRRPGGEESGDPGMSDKQMADIIMGQQDPASRSSMDRFQIENRVAFERQLSDIEDEIIMQLKDDSEDDPTTADVEAWAKNYRNSQNWPNWAIARIDQAQNRVLEEISKRGYDA